MNTTHTHQSPARVLRKLSEMFRSQADRLDKVETVRAKRAHAEQVQFVRAFRM
ncbi:MAG TPA: hypothetical protein GXZ60_12640 [Intrasporangiaceae bacterium]|nr:hypothetical protein [Intrasporangiaceae bacterium]